MRSHKYYLLSVTSIRPTSVLEAPSEFAIISTEYVFPESDVLNVKWDPRAPRSVRDLTVKALPTSACLSVPLGDTTSGCIVFPGNSEADGCGLSGIFTNGSWTQRNYYWQNIYDVKRGLKFEKVYHYTNNQSVIISLYLIEILIFFKLKVTIAVLFKSENVVSHLVAMSTSYFNIVPIVTQRITTDTMLNFDVTLMWTQF